MWTYSLEGVSGVLPEWLKVACIVGFSVLLGMLAIVVVTELSYGYHFTKWFLKNMKDMSESEKHYWWGQKE